MSTGIIPGYAVVASPRRVGLIERGEQNITIESLVKVAKALKCKVMDLVAEAGILKAGKSSTRR